MSGHRRRNEAHGANGLRARCLRTLCVPALFLPLALHAAEWGLDPSITASARYEDNIFLTTAPHVSVNGILVTPRLDFGAREQHWEVRGAAQLRSGRYSEDSLNTDDNIFTVKSRLLGPRSTWTLDLSRAQESIVTSESIDPDTGFGQTQQQRLTQLATPAWSWSINPRDQLVISYQFLGVYYESGAAVANLHDYRQDTYTVQWTRQQTARTQLSLTAFVADYDLDDIRYSSRTSGIQAGFAHQFSETFDLSFALGTRSTEIDQHITVCTLVFLGICVATTEEARRSTDTGYLVNAALTKQFELTRLQFELADTVSPSGSGSQVESYSATLKLERPIGSPLTGVRLQALGLRSRTIGGNAASNDRDLFRLEPSGYWRITNAWTLDMGYRYTRQQFDNSAASATGNTVFLNIGYKPERIVLP